MDDNDDDDKNNDDGDDDDENDTYNDNDDDDDEEEEKEEERNQDANLNNTDNDDDVQILFPSSNKFKFLNLTVWRIYIFSRTPVPLSLVLTMERAWQDIPAKHTSVSALLALQENTARKVKYAFDNLFRISHAQEPMSIAGFYCHVIKNKKLKLFKLLLPIRLGNNMASATNRDICRWVLLRKRKFISQGTHKHYSNTFSDTMTVQRTNSPKINHFSDSSLGRHVNAAPGKSLEIQACCITKRSAFS